MAAVSPAAGATALVAVAPGATTTTKTTQPTHQTGYPRLAALALALSLPCCGVAVALAAQFNSELAFQEARGVAIARRPDMAQSAPGYPARALVVYFAAALGFALLNVMGNTGALLRHAGARETRRLRRAYAAMVVSFAVYVGLYASGASRAARTAAFYPAAVATCVVSGVEVRRAVRGAELAVGRCVTLQLLSVLGFVAVYFNFVPWFVGRAGDGGRLAWRVVAHPLVLELGTAPGRLVMWRLGGSAPRRAAWGLFSLVLLGNLTGRALLFFFESGAAQTAAVLGTAAVEVLARATLGPRDRFFARRLFGPAYGDSLLPSAGVRVRAGFVVMDEVAELVGTAVATAAVLAFRFGLEPRAPDPARVLAFAGLQLGLEAATVFVPACVTRGVSGDSSGRSCYRRLAARVQRDVVARAAEIRAWARPDVARALALAVFATALAIVALYTPTSSGGAPALLCAVSRRGGWYHRMPCTSVSP